MPTDFDPARPLSLTMAMCDWDQMLAALTLGAVYAGQGGKWEKADRIDELRGKLITQISAAYAAAVDTDERGLRGLRRER